MNLKVKVNHESNLENANECGGIDVCEYVCMYVCMCGWIMQMNVEQ
jgi:hypothetical protein